MFERQKSVMRNMAGGKWFRLGFVEWQTMLASCCGLDVLAQAQPLTWPKFAYVMPLQKKPLDTHTSQALPLKPKCTLEEWSEKLIH